MGDRRLVGRRCDGRPESRADVGSDRRHRKRAGRPRRRALRRCREGVL